MKEHLYLSVLCGGGGTRLWPASRSKTPKQFLKLVGKETIFTQSIKDLKKIVGEDKIFVVTNADYVDEVIQQGGISLRNIVAEPQKRNTALAMAVGAAVIAKNDPEAVIINFPADNLVFPSEKFKSDMLALAGFVYERNCLGQVGTKPTFPATSFGYVRVERKENKFAGKSIFRAAEFKEKPDETTAKKFIESGNYFWNAAFYTWPARALLAACKRYVPQVFEGAMKIQTAWGGPNEQKVIKEVYEKAQDISIDYAVSEKTDNLYLIPSSFTWNDLGDWQKVWEISDKDAHNNVLRSEAGEIFDIESSGNLVWASKRLVSLIGVRDLIVVDTGDVLMICQKEKAQDVKKMVELLKTKEKKDYL